ncbi:MAG: hypothetical protein EOO90_08875 [Pedobacter sp.]|nr:MAG: hypothetical protein EOO90_08875 [Pedobacter sp.]
MQYKEILLSFLFLIVTLTVSHAQRPEFGVNAGGSGYIGEFNQFNPLKISGLNAGGFAKLNFDPHWGLGMHYNYGRIQGDDARSKNLELRNRNLNFQTSLHEVAIIGSFNLFDMYSPGSRKRISPYLFLGVGGIIFDRYYLYDSPDGSRTAYLLKGVMTEGVEKQLDRYAVVIPYGAGLKYKKTENWTLFGQIGYRATFTDYLDDVSGVYPNAPIADLRNNGYIVSDRSGEIRPNGLNLYNPGDQRGDFRKRDTYLFVNIGISYTFVSPKCFTF